MKKTYKMALMSALTLFSLSSTPFVLNDHLNVAQAAATKKTHHKKARKYAAKKHKVAKKQATKKKAAKKLRYKKAKKHVAKKKATRKFSYKKAKKHVAKKKFTRKLRYKKAKKVVAKKKTTKKHSYKKINHKRSRKAVSEKQNNSLANISDYKSQSNLNYNANSNPVENDTLDSNVNASTQNNFDTNSEPIEDNSNNNVTPHDSISDNNTNSGNQNNNNIQVTKELSNSIHYGDNNNINDGHLDEILGSAYDEVKMEMKKGIMPHISSDQSRIKQFAEFEFIENNNEKVKQESEFNSNYKSFSEDNIYNKSITTDDIANSEVIHFDPNIKYIPDPFDEVKMDLKNGIMPHISSDQSPIKQFAEFQSIVENNEKQKLQSEFKDADVDIKQDLPNRTVTLIINGDNAHPVIYHFNTNVKYIPNVFEEVKSDEMHGIKPHISSNQSSIKQFAEFEEIKLDNARYDYLLKNKNNENYNDVRGIKVFRDLPDKQITIVNTNDESLGNTYSFDPNAKLDY